MMTRPTLGTVKLFGFLMMIILMALPTHAPGAVATTQSSSPQTAGTATVEFLQVLWVYNPAASDPETAFLTHAELPGTAFFYGEVTDSTIFDTETALDVFAEEFFVGFGDGDHTAVDSGVVDTDTTWQLYTLGVAGVPHGAFVSANVDDIPGDVIITVLVSPVASFGEAADSVQEGVRINGGGTSLSAFEPQALSTSLEGGPSAAPAAAIQPTPASAPAQPAATLPALDLPGVTTQDPPAQPTVQLIESLLIGQAEVAWGGDWTYLPDASTPGQLAFFFNNVNTSTLLGFAAAPDLAGNVSVTLPEFSQGFIGSFGAANVVEVNNEVLLGGTGYALFTGEQLGTPIVILIHADVTTIPGEFRAMVLISPIEDFDAMFASAQQSFQVDGVGAMSDLDGAALAALLGTPGPAQAGDSVEATQPGTGVVAEFAAIDAEGACDTIGWVVTSPDQLPATEADDNYRAACVAGSAFVATCGTSEGGTLTAPDQGSTWVRCDITVRVDSAPIAVSGATFLLVDGDGETYTVDALALLGSTGSSNFPTGTISQGTTVEGSVVFPIPEGASVPWVIEITPDLIVATGQEPGTLVIDGELQPFEVFGS